MGFLDTAGLQYYDGKIKNYIKSNAITMGDRGSVIPDNTDYNDLVSPGSYYCTNSTSAATMVNAPASTSHRLIVFRGGSTDQIFQIAFCYGLTNVVSTPFTTQSPLIRMRYCYTGNASHTWVDNGEWTTLTTGRRLNDMLDITLATNWIKKGRATPKVGGTSTNAALGVRPNAALWGDDPWTIDDERNFADTTSVYSTYLPCNPGDIVHIYGVGGISCRLYMFLDSEGRQIKGSNINYENARTTATSNSTGNVSPKGELVMPAPYGTAYVVSNAYNGATALHYMYIETQKDNRCSFIDRLQHTNIARYSISEGEVFSGFNNMLKATSAIPYDSQIVPTTIYGENVSNNCIETTICKELNEIRAELKKLKACALADDYDPSGSTPYVVGDFAVRNGVLYKCTSPTSGTWNSSKWTSTTLKAEIS